MLKRWLQRCAALWRSSRIRDEINEELQFHIDQRTDENLRSGLPPVEARREAIRRFGPRLQIAERAYDVRGAGWLDALTADVRYALRLARTHWGFTAVAVCTLGLGVGANTAIFSVIHGILVRPLPYARPEEIVMLRQQMPRTGVDELLFSVPELNDYRKTTTTLSAIVEYHTDRFVLADGSSTERVRVGVVSHDFFDMFGVSTLIGRGFAASDERPGSTPVALLGYEYWTQRFGRDPAVVGKTFRTDGRLMTAVGVLPLVPQYPDTNDIYITTTSSPFRMSPDRVGNRNRRAFRAFARLRPGVTLAQANGDVARIAGGMQRQYPDSYPIDSGYSARVLGLTGEVTREARPTVWLLMAASAFVLLIACANVANFTLARAQQREPEWKLRIALGASRARVLRQLFAEGLVIGVLTAGVALLLAVVSRPLLIEAIARLTPRAGDIQINGWVIVFGLITATLTATAASSAPLLLPGGAAAGAIASRQRSTAGVTHTRVRDLLIVTQVTVAAALLVGAGLLVRSLYNLQHSESGVSDERVLTMHLDFDDSRYPTPAEQRAAGRRILDDVGRLPGVVSAADSSSFPLDPEALELGLNYMTNQFQVEGETASVDRPLPWVPVRLVSTGYFRTLGIPVLRGRPFSTADDAEHPTIVVVNRAFADHRIAGDPIGKRITKDGGTWLTIVGLVGNTKEYSLRETASDEVYYPIEQVASTPSSSWSVGSLLIRASVDPVSLESQVRRIITAAAPEAAVSRVATLSEARRQTLASPRLMTSLLALLAALALTLAAVGIAAMLVLSINQRMRELGVRLALGAQPIQIVTMLVTNSMKLVTIGLLSGLGLSVVLTHQLRAFLFHVVPTDWLTTVAAFALMATTAVGASYAAARRVTRISPVSALRHD